MATAAKKHSRTIMGRFLAILAAVAVWLGGVQCARAQCGTSLTRVEGGQTRAVCQATSTLLLVATGSNVYLESVANLAAPGGLARGTPLLRLPVPAVKLSMTLGSSRAYALLEDGRVAVIQLSSVGIFGPFPNTLSLIDTISSSVVDILANGTSVFVARAHEPQSVDDAGYSQLCLIDASGTTAATVSCVIPYSPTMYFDRISRVNNTIWMGMHGIDSNIYGLAGYNFTISSAPTSVTNSLNIATSLAFVRVTAMTTIGSRVFVAYKNPYGGSHSYVRAVDVSSPLSPGWIAETDIGTIRVNDLQAVGNLLHLAFDPGAVTVWDMTNPASPNAQGSYPPNGGVPSQLAVVPGTAFVADGAGGLLIVDTSTAGLYPLRSSVTPQPSSPSIVRQSSGITLVADTDSNTLRAMDYSGTGAPVAHGVLSLPVSPRQMELTTVAPSTYAAIAGTGDAVVRVYDVTNPDVLFYRGSFTPPGSTTLMAFAATMLYVFDNSYHLSVVDISNPQFPAVRASMAFGAGIGYRAMAAWGTAVALGTGTSIILIDTSNPASPQVRNVISPDINYSVYAMVKGPQALYASVVSNLPNSTDPYPHLDAYNVLNLSAPTRGIIAPMTWNAPTFLTYLPSGLLMGLEEYGPYAQADIPLKFFDVSMNFGLSPVQIDAETWAYGVHGQAAPSANGQQFVLAGEAAGTWQFQTPTQWRPAIISQPPDLYACLGGNAITFIGSDRVSSPSPVTFQWYRAEHTGTFAPLVDGPTGWGSTISGAQTPTLQITNVHAADFGVQAAGGYFEYSCRLSNSCGVSYSTSVRVRICLADFNCTGGVEVADIFAFLTAWFAHSTLADMNGDAQVTVTDIFAFLSLWFQGCP